MTHRTTSPTPTPAPAPASPATRRQALDSPSRRFRRMIRTRTTAVVGGAALLAVAGGALAVGTQPTIAEALGVPTAAATATPGLAGTALARAQAQATATTAQTVLATANHKTDTAVLERRLDQLDHTGDLSSAAITSRISSTVDAAQAVATASAVQDKRDADTAAAAAAAAKQAAAAAQRAAAEQAAAAAAARALAAGNTVAGAKATASALAASRYGWGSAQFQCLDSLWTKESGWNYQAVNANGGATGIPQALPGSKMATIAADWRTNATTQITWGLQYISASYGTPCAAWAHSQASNFY
ncbi:phospholipase [Curtobacterium sp. ISL-83]|uniref:aggregation-promoting factor C-terminal-like domain-containing protein n=1 Tax=Curtobacterium sp. ISL-83 TaxID=2819145 RepID=UPI001BE8631B|nr:phospholipase [Curtobacterium sp. ISL-83]MBT2503489.1 phospholipase [Curtobacterium sp. ISL-83]